MKRFFIFLIAAIGMLAACEKPVYFDIEDTEPKVVVNSVISADSSMVARVTLSRFFLDNTNFKVVNDAVLRLTVNGVAASPASYNKGFYTISVSPQAGDTLHLEVSVPGRGMVSAGTRVPYMPNVPQMKVLNKSMTEYGESSLKFLLALNDRAQEHVGYQVRAMVYDTVDFDTTYSERWDWDLDRVVGYDTILPHQEIVVYSLSMECDDPILASGFDLGDIFDFKANSCKSEYVDRYLFLDDAFSGSSHDFIINGSYYDYYSNDYMDDQITHHRWLEIEVQALNYDLYMYTKTRMQQRNSDDLFSEPVQIYCNIKDGIGIFGAMNKTVKKIPID